MQLKEVDWIALSRFDRRTMSLNFFDTTIFNDPESVHRLQKAGIVDDKGNLTEKGSTTAKALAKKVDQLRLGVPYSKRKANNPDKLLELPNKWFTGTVSQKPYFTNGEMFILGRPGKAMSSAKGSGELRHQVPSTVASIIATKGVIEVLPHTWMVFGLGGLDVIWFANEDKNTFVAIQSVFFDYIRSKYPTARFYTVKGSSTEPVQARVRNRGLKNNVVAVVMPVEITDKKFIPKKRGGNGQSKDSEDGE